MDAGGQYTAKFVGNVTQDGYTEYQIKVTSPQGNQWQIRKRYRQIRELHEHMRLRFADRVPSIPGKRFFLWNNDPAFIKSRQQGLEAYMQAVLGLDPRCETKALAKFLELPPVRPATAQASSQPSVQDVMENFQKSLFDLSQTPTTLDPGELEQRVQKYNAMLKEHVYSEPIDPILHQAGLTQTAPPKHTSDSGANGHSEATAEALDKCLAGLNELLDPRKPIPVPEGGVVVPFAPVVSED